MSALFLIPIISIFDVHDFAVSDWLNKLGDSALRKHLDYPFKLTRFFSDTAQHALKSVDDVHSEIVRLLDCIDPQAVFLDISVDFVELENKYNKRVISPFEFWSEYYQISAKEDESHAIYCIYIKGIIDKKIRLIESKEHLPFTITFYGTDIKTREELIPVHENVLEKDDEFLLAEAEVVNEIASFHELPKHILHSPMQLRKTDFSYEETEKFYSELLMRLIRLLKYKVKDYIIRNLKNEAAEFLQSYENFLDYKIREDEIKVSNILEGLSFLDAQTDCKDIVIFCTPMHYTFLSNALKEKKLSERFSIGKINAAVLLEKMRPFMQKSRIMQSNYDIALKIIGGEKPGRFNNPGAVLFPTDIPH